MNAPLRTTVEQAFVAVESRNVDAVLAFFADDAVMIDPHYPTPHMAGKAAIASGLRWAYSGMQKMGFTILCYFEAPDRQSAAVEVATAHVLRTGMPLRFSQVFVFDTRDGLITRMQAYEPYGPSGVAGAFLALTRLGRRLAGWRQPSSSS